MPGEMVFRPEERTAATDYDAVPSGLVDRVLAGAARGDVDEGDLRRLERVAEKLLPMRLAPDEDEEVTASCRCVAGLQLQRDASCRVGGNWSSCSSRCTNAGPQQVAPEELLKVAEFLQLALEYEMYNHDKKEDDLEVSSSRILVSACSGAGQQSLGCTTRCLHTQAVPQRERRPLLAWCCSLTLARRRVDFCLHPRRAYPSVRVTAPTARRCHPTARTGPSQTAKAPVAAVFSLRVDRRVAVNWVSGGWAGEQTDMTRPSTVPNRDAAWTSTDSAAEPNPAGCTELRGLGLRDGVLLIPMASAVVRYD